MRKLFSLLVCVWILSTCCLSVLAHSGRTDASGGHWNRSTGDYHYHHGYSAHDHYDIDGDRDADCPYDYKNKTIQRSNNSKTTTNSTTPTTNVKQPNVISKKKELSFIDILLVSLFSLTTGCVMESIIAPFISLAFPEDKSFSVTICLFGIITIASFIFILRIF